MSLAAKDVLDKLTKQKVHLTWCPWFYYYGDEDDDDDDDDDDSNNRPTDIYTNNNGCIYRAPFHVKHAHLR